MRFCSRAAPGGCIHPGHHDGCAGRDGFRGPATEPAAAEQIQLQPARCGQRACSDDWQWLVRYTLLTRERERERGKSVGRGNKEREGDEMQEILDEERRNKRELHFCSSTFLPSSFCPSLLWLVQLDGDQSSPHGDHTRRHSSKLSGTLYYTIKQPLSVVLLSA